MSLIHRFSCLERKKLQRLDRSKVSVCYTRSASRRILYHAGTKAKGSTELVDLGLDPIPFYYWLPASTKFDSILLWISLIYFFILCDDTVGQNRNWTRFLVVRRCKLSGFGCKLPKDGWDANISQQIEMTQDEVNLLHLSRWIHRMPRVCNRMVPLPSAEGQLEQNSKSFCSSVLKQTWRPSVQELIASGGKKKKNTTTILKILYPSCFCFFCQRKGRPDVKSWFSNVARFILLGYPIVPMTRVYPTLDPSYTSCEGWILKTAIRSALHVNIQWSEMKTQRLYIFTYFL